MLACRPVVSANWFHGMAVMSMLLYHGTMPFVQLSPVLYRSNIDTRGTGTRVSSLSSQLLVLSIPVGRRKRLTPRQPAARITVSLSDATKKSTSGRESDTSSRKDSNLKDSVDDSSSNVRQSDANGKKWMARARHWIVLVDDDESTRLAMGDYLYDCGYQVTACADVTALLHDVLQLLDLQGSDKVDVIADSAEVQGKDENDSSYDHFAQLNAHHRRPLPASLSIPSVIISDIRMPNSIMNGIQLVSYLRSHLRYKRVPILFLTAKSMIQDRIIGYKAGGDAYLTKPFVPEELCAMVDNLIRRRREMTAGTGGLVADMKNDMEDIKQCLRRNGKNVQKRRDGAFTANSAASRPYGQQQQQQQQQRHDVDFTPAERQVLDLLCLGKTNKEIAQEKRKWNNNKANIGKSTKDVSAYRNSDGPKKSVENEIGGQAEKHKQRSGEGSITSINRVVQNLFLKTQTRNRTELILWAIANGQVERPQ